LISVWCLLFAPRKARSSRRAFAARGRPGLAARRIAFAFALSGFIIIVVEANGPFDGRRWAGLWKGRAMGGRAIDPRRPGGSGRATKYHEVTGRGAEASQARSRNRKGNENGGSGIYGDKCCVPRTLDLPAGIDLDGIDQLAMLRGEKGKILPKRFWQWNRYTPAFGFNSAMRDGPWKLVLPSCREVRAMTLEDGAAPKQMRTARKFSPTPPPEIAYPAPGKPELYNLENAPCEKNNLADCEPAKVSKMYTELEAWFNQVEGERLKNQ
jgi:hypothetical protein